LRPCEHAEYSPFRGFTVSLACIMLVVSAGTPPAVLLGFEND
jgi:hypothetical protein